MNCAKLESDLALYAGGDLPAGRAARLEGHLGNCADCRALVEGLRASRQLCSELRDEPLEDAMVAQVRRRVLARIGAAETAPRAGYWKWAMAAALVLAAILALPRRVGEPASVARRAVVATTKAAPVAPIIRPVRHKIARRRRPGPPLLVQFTTTDPNIVIYWLVDQKTQGD
jgi:anti-sigma factor RsiW